MSLNLQHEQVYTTEEKVSLKGISFTIKKFPLIRAPLSFSHKGRSMKCALESFCNC